MDDVIKNEIHKALRDILPRLDGVGVTLATEERGDALVATIAFRRLMSEAVITISGVYSAPIAINGNALPKLSHNIFRRIELAIYCDDVPDVFLLEKVVVELKNAFLRTEGSPFSERVLGFAIRDCPDLLESVLSLNLYIEAGDLYCDGFRDVDGLIVRKLATPHKVYGEARQPHGISLTTGFSLVAAIVSAQCKFAQYVRNV